MRLPTSEILSRAAAPQLAAAALSALLLLPGLGPVPPALADGDTKEFKFPAHRPRQQGPLQVDAVRDGPGERRATCCTTCASAR